tara:strand:+ start:1426 stop:1734 length:309 start_codon:yes stop_codon:yes gene_type:complete
MLTNIVLPATGTALKQIVAQSVATNSPFYTVPESRVFTGHLILSGATSAQFKINNVLVVNYSGSTNYWQEAVPFTLTAGTVCSSGSGFGGVAGVLVGVEEDA